MKHNETVKYVAVAPVAPRAGAWIETIKALIPTSALTSPPARGRGLKLATPSAADAAEASPPARGRGLKPVLHCGPVGAGGSPPARGRGLKPVAEPVLYPVW